jgi:hypothetical protein
VAAFSLAGCGGVKLHPVEGIITYADGTPMPGGGYITFTPVDEDLKFSARGIIQEDGTFKMGTHKEGDGVPEGTYRVAIVPTPPRSQRNAPPDWPPIAKKYSNHEESGLEYTVTPGVKECKFTVEK